MHPPTSVSAITLVDVARIVWPNGVVQAEFDTAADGEVVAEQRLKGSCPWLFAFDGTGMRFVTDVLWRSPLGLRINAQDTAGVTQTEDWVKVGSNQLVPRNGQYDLRVTAELWETHFFDHVSILAVDHPAGTEIFVDERFSRARPDLTVRATAPLRPILKAWDAAGRDVTDILRARDGRYLGGFGKGRYQGIAQEHFVEFEIDPAAAARQAWLVAYGGASDRQQHQRCYRSGRPGHGGPVVRLATRLAPGERFTPTWAVSRQTRR